MCSIFKNIWSWLVMICCCKRDSEQPVPIEMKRICRHNPAASGSYPSSSTVRSTVTAEHEKETTRQNRQALRIKNHWRQDSFDDMDSTPPSSPPPFSSQEWKHFPASELPQYLQNLASKGNEGGLILFPKPKFIKPLP